MFYTVSILCGCCQCVVPCFFFLKCVVRSFGCLFVRSFVRSYVFLFVRLFVCSYVCYWLFVICVYKLLIYYFLIIIIIICVTFNDINVFLLLPSDHWQHQPTAAVYKHPDRERCPVCWCWHLHQQPERLVLNTEWSSTSRPCCRLHWVNRFW